MGSRLAHNLKVGTFLLIFFVYLNGAFADCEFEGSQFTNKAECAKAVVTRNSDVSRRCYFESHNQQPASSPWSAAQQTEQACLQKSKFVSNPDFICGQCPDEVFNRNSQPTVSKYIAPIKAPTPKPKPPAQVPTASAKTPAKTESDSPVEKSEQAQARETQTQPAPQTSHCRDALAYAKASCEPQPQAQNFAASGAGRLEYCQQLEAASKQTTQSNAAQAGACYSAYSACSRQCASEGAYNLAKACQAFKQSFDTYQTQAQNSGRENGYAEYCGSVSNAMPSSVQGAAKVDGQTVSYTQTGGVVNEAPAPSATESQRGSSGYRKAEQVGYQRSSGVYVPEGQELQRSFVKRMNEALKYEQVANGSADSVPQSAKPARLDTPKSSPGDSGFDVQSLEQGFRSGGGYTYGGEMPLGQESSAHQVSRAVASESSPYFLGMDLRKYLPRFMMSGESLRRQSDINGPGVDIFAKVSARYKEKCRLGNLLDCRD
jgi:hypothetical protein